MAAEKARGTLGVTSQSIAAAASRIMARCAELRAISANLDGYERLYLTAEHRRAAELIIGWMEAAGLSARIDAGGNVIGRVEGGDATRAALVLASHFDTVRNAGTYDGQLGVVTAIETAAHLAVLKASLPFPIEVHAYADEEGTRFHTMLLGSGFVSGTEDRQTLNLRDGDEVSIAEAMRSFGLDPDAIGKARRRPGDFRAYLEVHIEQGPVLEAENLAVGTVTAIAGQTRGTIIVKGVAGHAGTVPMNMRSDALTGAAEAILAIEAIAGERSDIVATVGEIRVEPGSSNVIPALVRFTLDLRSPGDSRRADALLKIEAALTIIAAARKLQIQLEIASSTRAIACDAALVATIDQASEAVHGRAIHLVSGAGHDAIALASLCPIGMIFVRCKGGISHNPAESITEADAGAGFAALALAVLNLMEQA